MTTDSRKPLFDRPLDFAAGVGVRAVSSEGVVLYGPGRHAVYRGTLASRVAEAVDGSRTAEDVAHVLRDTCGMAAVFFALLQLERDGWIAPAATPAQRASSDQAAAAFLDAAAVDARATAGALGAEVDLDRRRGWPDAPVFARDYSDDALAAPNARALAAGAPWLLARAATRVVWVGPWFVPGQTACWACLRHALARVEAGRAAARRIGVELRAPADQTGPLAQAAAARLATTHLALGREYGVVAPAAGVVLAFDPEARVVTRHAVRRRPQCPACGDAGRYAQRATAPFVLAPCPAAPGRDGGVRAEPPDRWLARHAGLVDAVTGLVPALLPVGTRAGDGSPVHTVTSGPNDFRAPDTLAEFETSLRSHNGGKGRTEVQARAGALGEAVERASAAWQGDEPVERASARALAARGERVVGPNAVLRFSDAQYAGRDAWNVCADATARVPRPFDPEQPLDWSPVWSLTRGARAWLPSGQLYFDHPAPPGAQVAVACSNGIAAGASREDAFLQALLELVERDAVAVWWYNRLMRPALPLDALGGSAGAFARAAVAWWRGRGRALWALDLTHDLGVPVVAALSCRSGPGGGEQVLFGFGAHLRPEIALERAVGELAQVEGAWRTGGGRVDGDHTLARWLRTATLATDPYLAPSGAAADASWEERVARAPEIRDVGEAAEACRGALEAAGLEVLALDLTRPDYDVPVVRAIVPGLRHFWPRFAPGRLYDVPVRLGWRGAPTAEEALNPVPFFL